MRISDWSSDVCSSDLNDGWFDTGDLARIDARGNVTITGRAKDLIKSGGEWINPAEIEAIIAALPQVALVAVIGRADPKWGERPILVVETRVDDRSEEHTSELQSLMRISYAVFCLKKKKKTIR